MPLRRWIGTLLILAALLGTLDAEEPSDFSLKMFRGAIENVAEAPKPKEPGQDPFIPADSARKAFHYLNGNPMPEHDWQCQFSLGPLGIPCLAPIVAANQYGVDPVSLGDSDIRMEIQFLQMKEIAGITETTAAEQGVRKRVRGYLKEDGLCWCNPSAATGTAVDGLWAMSWTSQFELRSLCEEYRHTKSESVRTTAKNLFNGIKRLTLWEGNLAYLPGLAPWRDGRWLRDGWCREHARQYPQVLEALVDYAETFNDKEALSLACSYGDGVIAGLPKDLNELKVDPETGFFRGHTHSHTNVFWGMAHLGAVTGEEKYTKWAATAIEKVWQNGTDYGWIPEFSPDNNANEICVLGDFVPASLYLAKTVGPLWYDRVDCTVRNTLARSQFQVTDAFLKLFSSLHKNLSSEELQKALDTVRRLNGGFVSQTSMSGDWVLFPEKIGSTGMYTNGIQMMGCCPPSGMNALWAWWNAAIEERPDGIFVNFALTRNSECGRLTSYAMADGRLDVVCEKPGAWFIRIPGWTKREGVTLQVNGSPQAVQWGGPEDAYVVFDKAVKGDTLEIQWPVPSFTQTFPYHGRELKVQWTGSEVTAMRRTEPVFLPMYPELKEN